MEEPVRLLIRLGLNFIRNLFSSKVETQINSMNSCFDHLYLQTKSISDQMSISHSAFDVHSLSNNVSCLSKKRNKQWKVEDELKLVELINKSQKDIQDLSDKDWSEIAQKLDLTP